MADRQMELWPRRGGPSDFRVTRRGGLYNKPIELHPNYFDFMAEERARRNREIEETELRNKIDAPRLNRDFFRRTSGRPLPSDPPPPAPRRKQTEINFPKDESLLLSEKVRAFIERLENKPKEREQMRFPGDDWFKAMQHRKEKPHLWEALRQLRSRQTPVLEEEAKGKDFLNKWIEWKRQMAQEVLPFIPPLRGLKGLGKVIPKLKGK